MKVLSVRMSDEEYAVLKSYAKKHSSSMSEVLKKSFFTKLEDEEDIKVFDKAYQEYLKDRKTYSSEEVIKLLGLD